MSDTTIRRACCVCGVPLDGLGAITIGDISHGYCDTCGADWYGDLWGGRGDVTRWAGADLLRARNLAGHGTRWLARRLGVARSTIRRSEKRPHVTPYVMARLVAAPRVHAYYRGLTGAA